MHRARRAVFHAFETSFCPSGSLWDRLVVLIVLLSIGVLPVCGRAQSSATPSASSGRLSTTDQPSLSDYKLKVSTQLVALDVVVRDAQGRVVPGLKVEDFTVLQDKVPQKIRSFDFTSSLLGSAGTPIRIDSTAELDRREPQCPVTILVLDEIVTRFEDQYFARYSIDQYIGKQGDTLDQPTMLIARRADRTIVLSDYTTSKRKLRDALKHHLAMNDWAANNPNFTAEQTAAAFASLLQIARATQGHQGHKNVVWIGRGFPALQWNNMQADQVDRLKRAVADCVEALRESRVTLYVIDPAGVSGFSSTSDENGVLSLEDPFDDGVGFDSLARATGGTAMHGRNDVDHLIADAVAGGENFYTLTYRPTAPADQGTGTFHKIQVRLREASLTAISREGYYAGTENASPAAADRVPTLKDTDRSTAAFDLASASTGLMVFDGVPLTLTQPSSPVAPLQISFPASALGLKVAGDKLRGDLTLITLSYDQSGRLLARDGRIVSLHLSLPTAAHAEDRIIHLSTPLKTDLPIARVRIVVRSESNGKIGAENYYVGKRSGEERSAGNLKGR